MTRKIDEIISDLIECRDYEADVSAQLAEAKRATAEIENELMEVMQEHGIRRAESHGLTVSVGESIVPQIKDWEAFERFVLRNNALFLMERRVHTTAWRELLAEREGVEIPGVEPFARVKLTVRTGSSSK